MWEIGRCHVVVASSNKIRTKFRENRSDCSKFQRTQKTVRHKEMWSHNFNVLLFQVDCSHDPGNIWSDSDWSACLFITSRRSPCHEEAYIILEWDFRFCHWWIHIAFVWVVTLFCPFGGYRMFWSAIRFSSSGLHAARWRQRVSLKLWYNLSVYMLSYTGVLQYGPVEYLGRVLKPGLPFTQVTERR